MAGKPWYAEGLRFTCTQCGDCCTGAPGFVWVNQEEIAALAGVVGMSIEDFEQKFVRRVGVRRSLIEHDNGDCVFLDTEKRNCSVYEARPRQCRTWPFWESNIKTPEAWQSTCDVCPGSGKGNLVPLDEIRRRAETMRL